MPFPSFKKQKHNFYEHKEALAKLWQCKNSASSKDGNALFDI